MLNMVVEPFLDTLFESHNWCFQHDSAAGHKAKWMQTWLTKHTSDFITSSEWSLASPGLNPSYYQFNSNSRRLSVKGDTPHQYRLKAIIVKAAHAMPIKIIHAAIDTWPSNYFEWFFLTERQFYVLTFL